MVKITKMSGQRLVHKPIGRGYVTQEEIKAGRDQDQKMAKKS